MKRAPRGRAKRGAKPGAKGAAKPGVKRAAKPGVKRDRVAPGWTPADLLARAEVARKHAYAPYSRFHVGAALLTADGRVFEGCNVENASFGLSICAERNALWKAVSEGVREFEAVAVTAGPKHGASPCGACRQSLYEFAPRMWVIWRDDRGRLVKKRLGRLLDSGFVFPGRER